MNYSATKWFQANSSTNNNVIFQWHSRKVKINEKMLKGESPVMSLAASTKPFLILFFFCLCMQCFSTTKTQRKEINLWFLLCISLRSVYFSVVIGKPIWHTKRIHQYLDIQCVKRIIEFEGRSIRSIVSYFTL